jgi:hypothetical protein
MQVHQERKSCTLMKVELLEPGYVLCSSDKIDD